MSQNAPATIRAPQVHETAVVHPDARLSHDVVIGPYCIVGEGVTLGPGCTLASHVRLDGPLTCGAGNRFFHGAAIGGEPQDKKYTGDVSGVRIGDDNLFREYVTVNRATRASAETVIGNSNLFMAYVHIAHDCLIHDHVVLANSVNLAGHVEAEDHAIVGGVTPVHQFVRIGCHSIVGGGFRVPKDIPPYMKAGGNPLRIVGLNSLGLERHRFSPDVCRDLKETFRILCRAGLNVSQALAKLREKFPDSREVRHLVEFVEASDRGIVR